MAAGRARMAYGQPQGRQPLDINQVLTAAAGAAGTYVSATEDVFTAAAVAQAKLDNAIVRGAPQSTINVLRARAAAARRRAELALRGEASTTEWAGLGKAGTVVAIGLLAALTVSVLVRTFRA